MDDMQKRILDIIDEHQDEIIDFVWDLYDKGEPGFREFETSKKVISFFEKYNIPYKKQLAITGVKGKLVCGEKNDVKKVNVAVLGELDGVACKAHPHANKQNGISHTCGHNIQLGALIGTLIALSDPQIKQSLDGTVTFFAVPSEEFSDLDYKSELIKEGKLRYGGGKSELIGLGEFDDVDMAITTHLHMTDEHSDVMVGFNTTNGFISKLITYSGKASHAAIAPHKGVNALSAANIGFNALSFQRETFKDSDHVRVHPIILKGGTAVNAVPDEVILETQVRAKTMSALMDASHKTNRAFEAGAHAMGAQLEIKDFAGYLPVLPLEIQKPLFDAGQVLKENGASVTLFDIHTHNPASTDAGDLSHIMPLLGFTTGNFDGALHSKEFTITDKQKAYIIPAKMMALTVYNLLKDNAVQAHEILEHFYPALTKQEYIDYMDSFK